MMKRTLYLAAAAMFLASCSTTTPDDSAAAETTPSTTEEADHSGILMVDTLSRPWLYTSISVGTIVEEVPGEAKPTPEDIANCKEDNHDSDCTFDGVSVQMFDLLIAVDKVVVGDVPEQVVYERAGRKVITDRDEVTTDPSWFEVEQRVIVLGDDTGPAVMALPVVDGRVDAGLDGMEDITPVPLRAELDGLPESEAIAVLEAALSAPRP